MKLYFEVKLESDIIINQKAATEGPNATLNFIPGANFMGVVASTFYKTIDDKKKNGVSCDELQKLQSIALDIFHSGKVRFGDAHLAADGVRSNKVPASMFYPKLQKPSEKLYICHAIPQDAETQARIKDEQIKQCREGFYDFVADECYKVDSETHFAIKSAHDREKRTSKDAQMYGYQSLCSGCTMLFEVEMAEGTEKYAAVIKSLLEGKKRIGRSRSSEYGLVSIKSLTAPYKEVEWIKKSGTVTVYADSRLVFLDDATGIPTFRPTEEQLGLNSGNIDWSKSQIRTFQYSPWNFKRQCFDTDRCGIEKGSVFVVDDVKECTDAPCYKGEYKSEGFGRLIYNPSFLEADESTGLANKHILETKNKDNSDIVVDEIFSDDSTLMIYLKNRYYDEKDEQRMYEMVNKWVNDNAPLFRRDKEAFASQWGTIRSIAMQYKTEDRIMYNLFDKKVKDKRTGKDKDCAYLTHGVAADKWRGERLEQLKSFCKDLKKKLNNEKFFRLAIINLAAMMAKRCRKENVK